MHIVRSYPNLKLNYLLVILFKNISILFLNYSSNWKILKYPIKLLYNLKILICFNKVYKVSLNSLSYFLLKTRK